MARSLLNAMEPHVLGPLLSRLLEIADDAIVIADESHRIVLFNEGAERIFGRTVDETLGQQLDLLLPQAARASHARHMRAFAQSAVAARRMGDRRELHGLRADGSVFDAEASISHVELDGRIYFTAILRDVTEHHTQSQALERARSEAEAATRAKSLFLANMSHEIRTPLNAVIGMTTLLLDTPMSEDQRDFARTIRASGESLLEVINDILDYSKADVGRLEIERRPFDLRQLVEQSLDLVTPRALEKNLNLAYLIEDGTPEALVGDPTRLRQVLVNLLSNAVKFTHQGEVFVAVEAQPLDGGTMELHFSVRDTGIGIAADQLPRLFQSFTQVDASTTRKYGGTGLGLAISKRLAELMGGSVSAESEPGHGSTFHAVVRVYPGVTAEPAEFLQHNAPALLGKRILIVDDNLTNRRIVTRLVLRWGMLPSTFPSALEAMDRIRHGEPFDLALLDMSMPDIDGLDLAAEIRRLRTPLELPIVMLTSLGQRQVGEVLGLAACLSKPIKASVLFSTLVAVLDGSRSGAQPPAPLVPQQQERPVVPLRVLVAEDNPINQRVAMRLLQHLGYRADVVADGRAAVQACERVRYDVVLMDVQMPELDGVQAAQQIVARRGNAGTPRIVAMTANAMPGDRETYLQAGMDGYLAKPIDLSQLSAVLANASILARPADAARQDEELVLDLDRLEHLRTMQDDSQPTLVRELIDMFLASAGTQVDRMIDTLAHGDAESLRAQAHRYLSATQNIGACRLSALCAELERQARQGRLEGAAVLLDEIGQERERVQAALSAQRIRF